MFEVTANLKDANAKYKSDADQHRRLKWFFEGDLVMVHLQKSRFPAGTYHKLQPQSIGRYHIKKRINDNAYIIDLSSHLQFNSTFNVADLSPYFSPDDALAIATNSELSFFSVEENWCSCLSTCHFYTLFSVVCYSAYCLLFTVICLLYSC